METVKALSILSKIIAGEIREYDLTEDSKTIKDGIEIRVAHPLDALVEEDKIFYLDMALKDVALSASPISLIETTGSVASELRRVSTSYYIRVPKEPLLGDVLDIDDGLAYAVVYSALAGLWSEFGEYAQKSDSIVNTYIQAYRDYLEDLIEGNIGSGAETYIRFSQDAENWQDSFTLGDLYISFKKVDTDTWTNAIKFIGQNGVDGVDGSDGTNGADGVDGGGGSSSFVTLTDTPNTLIADKFLQVNNAGNTITLVDAPSAGQSLANANPFGDVIFFDDSASADIYLDASTQNVFYLYPSANSTLNFISFDDGGSVPAYWGTTYTFMLVSSGNTSIIFDDAQSILGDSTVVLGSASGTTGITMTILKMIFSGYDWYVVSKEVIINANG